MIPRLLITAALALALALSALVATTRGVSSQGTDPASVVQAYIAAVNAHNVDAVLALYADDAVHEAIPAPPGAQSVYIGKAQIRQFYQQTVVNHDHLEVVGTPQVVGDKVMYTKRIASDSFRRLGLATLDASIVAIVQGGKFTSYTAAFTPDSLAKLQAAIAAASEKAMLKRVKVFPLAEFPAVGLPAGPAIVQPVHLIFPHGLTSKHTHGGPTYVYVIRGLLQVSDAKGTKTYGAGGFFWERTGYIHTLHVIKDTEVFSLRFVPPGTPGTVEAK
jgi:quercetin dioxygenase-like cupin family protein